ncbi:MAG: ATP-grasp domain-containing protein [Leptolyngbyaceae bacterium]|nr:ATP-grasp domain-containing protein [Leptolyngbyaceae bacterium]
MLSAIENTLFFSRDLEIMWASLKPNIPILCIDNFYDYNLDFLNRCETLVETRDFFKNSCSRFMWYGGWPKLVISRQGTVLRDYFRNYFGFSEELITIPANVSGSTVEGIIQSQTVIEKIIEFIGSQKKLQVISWGGTWEIWELADFLETQFSVLVHLPETAIKENLWIQRYLDTKLGFRTVASSIFNRDEDVIPEGYICLNIDEMYSAVDWFRNQEKGCIIKPNKGLLGKGIIAVDNKSSDEAENLKVIFDNFRNLFSEEPIIVEERILSPSKSSPSIEYYIPPINEGNPKSTYLVKQYLHDDFCFLGNVISKELEQEPWYALLMKNAYRLAERVQQLGYVGYMDIDCIVDEHQNPYFVEVNPRRTGGTHYHEMALRLFGEDYLEKISLISNSHLHSYAFRTFEELFHGSSDLLYNPGDIERGIIISEANLLASHGIVSVASIGRDIKEAAHYLSLFQERIGSKDTI